MKHFETLDDRMSKARDQQLPLHESFRFIVIRFAYEVVFRLKILDMTILTIYKNISLHHTY